MDTRLPMDTKLPKDPQFIKNYTKHCKHLKLNGLQPKTIDAYSRAIRRIGNYFNCQIHDLSPDQLPDWMLQPTCHSDPRNLPGVLYAPYIS